MSAITNAPLISIDEYIARFVAGNEEPSCEYLDGELIPKSIPTKQVNIGFQIRSQYAAALNPLTELTTRLREGRFCIPDVAVEELSKPIQGRYPDPENPVMLCVEIISPPDRLGKLFSKCEEYHTWGVLQLMLSPAS